MNLFVTGTDTDVGKTIASLALCNHLDLGYWKPIQCGTPRDTDIIKNFGIKTSVEAYCLEHPLSPHLAAQLSQQTISLDHVVSLKPQDSTMIEGAGGVFVPLNSAQFMFDLIKALECKTVVVSRSRLGTINHTLLTLELLKSKKIEVVGVIMVGDPNFENKEAIENFGQVKVIGQLPFLEHITLHQLSDITKNWEFSWFNS